MSFKHGQTVKVDLYKIKSYEKNPRINTETIPLVKESIKTYGYLNKIIINKDGYIVCGHTRHQALIELHKEGFLENSIVEAIYVELEKPEFIALNLLDNQLTIKSKWDNSLLKENLNFLINEDCSLDLLGFEENQLKDILEENSKFNFDEKENDDEFDDELSFSEENSFEEENEEDDEISDEDDFIRTEDLQDIKIEKSLKIEKKQIKNKILIKVLNSEEYEDVLNLIKTSLKGYEIEIL